VSGRSLESDTLAFDPEGAQLRSFQMLGWALTFLVVALIAGLLGFTSIAGGAMAIAKILFFVFLVLFVVSLVMHMVRGRSI
jgi:uncharacterized membrane protein YtjA (UPF0391 family)